MPVFMKKSQLNKTMKSRQGDLFLNKCRPAPSNRLSFNSFALCVFVIKKLRQVVDKVMNNVYWMDGRAGRWTDKRRNLPADQVNEGSQDLEPSRGADGTKKRILFRGPAALECACSKPYP
ncbi:hypothetical protein R6Z07F_009449 [Ovis aries]